VNGRADGTTVRAHVANEDVRREPYGRLANTPRPGHADFPARTRYGPSADLSGGGIFSGRMTVGLVIAGSVARSMLQRKNVEIAAFTRSIGPVEATVPDGLPLDRLARSAAENEVGCPDPQAARRMEEAIASARRDGDSLPISRGLDGRRRLGICLCRALDGASRISLCGLSENQRGRCDH